METIYVCFQPTDYQRIVTKGKKRPQMQTSMIIQVVKMTSNDLGGTQMTSNDLRGPQMTSKDLNRPQKNPFQLKKRFNLTYLRTTN